MEEGAVESLHTLEFGGSYLCICDGRTGMSEG
jgi:hypothetical protein